MGSDDKDTFSNGSYRISYHGILDLEVEKERRLGIGNSHVIYLDIYLQVVVERWLGKIDWMYFNSIETIES